MLFYWYSCNILIETEQKVQCVLKLCESCLQFLYKLDVLYVFCVEKMFRSNDNSMLLVYRVEYLPTNQVIMCILMLVKHSRIVLVESNSKVHTAAAVKRLVYGT